MISSIHFHRQSILYLTSADENYNANIETEERQLHESKTVSYMCLVTN